MSVTCKRAAELLAGSQHPGLKDRLLACALALLGDHPASPSGGGHAEEFKAPLTWRGFSFRAAVRRYERFLLELALRDAGGLVTRAAQLLGFKHHRSLISLINHRHKDLLQARSPVWPRRRSIIMPEEEAGGTQGGGSKKTAAATILLVEDNEVVADAVKETLEHQGWKVVNCGDGRTARQKISSGVRYDLLLLDNELPGMKGIDLVRHARKLPHRRRTPIIVLSASDCEREAWRAGADAFLRKPQDVGVIVQTIERLLRKE